MRQILNRIYDFFGKNRNGDARIQNIFHHLQIMKLRDYVNGIGRSKNILKLKRDQLEEKSSMPHVDTR